MRSKKNVSFNDKSAKSQRMNERDQYGSQSHHNNF